MEVSSNISLEMDVSEETVAGLCLRALENRVPVRELRVTKLRARSTDYAALIDILRRSPALEVRKMCTCCMPTCRTIHSVGRARIVTLIAPCSLWEPGASCRKQPFALPLACDHSPRCPRNIHPGCL